MHLKLIGFIIFFMVFPTIVVLSMNNKSQTSLSEGIKVLPKRSVYLGAWVGGFWESKTKTLNTEVLKEFEKARNSYFSETKGVDKRDLWV